jgi:hypothetical protein
MVRAEKYGQVCLLVTKITLPDAVPRRSSGDDASVWGGIQSRHETIPKCPKKPENVAKIS